MEVLDRLWHNGGTRVGWVVLHLLITTSKGSCFFGQTLASLVADQSSGALPNYLIVWECCFLLFNAAFVFSLHQERCVYFFLYYNCNFGFRKIGARKDDQQCLNKKHAD